MNSFCLALKEGIVYMDLRAEAEVCIGASIIFFIWFVHQQIFNVARVQVCTILLKATYKV